MKKTIVIIVLAVALLLVGCKEKVEYYDENALKQFAFEYDELTDGYTINSKYSSENNEYKDSTTDIAIPLNYGSDKGIKKVTKIGKSAFKDYTSLETITIPESILSIDEEAFPDCKSLKYNEYDNAYYLGNSSNPYLVLVKAIEKGITSCNINDKCKIIYHAAFKDCASLKTVTIPDSVISIGNKVFFGCDSLEYKDYYGAEYLGNDNNPYLVIVKARSSTIEECVVHHGCRFILDGSYKKEKSHDYYYHSFNSYDKYVNIYSFSGCSSLKSITFPSTLKSIGENAFDSCISLSKMNSEEENEINFRDSIELIEKEAFKDCKFIEIINIPDKVKYIDGDAFKGCTSIKRINSDTDGVINIPNCFKEIRKEAFINCLLFKEVNIPKSIKRIGEYAFSDCQYLESIDISDNVVEIGQMAFYDCFSLSKISIPKSVETIEGGAFYNCISLKSISISDSVKTIGNATFYRCLSLERIDISDLRAWAEIEFESPNANPVLFTHNLYLNDELLTDIIIPDGTTKIGSYAFYSFPLKKISIPNSVKSIGTRAFELCSSLEEVEMPDNMESIGSKAFLGCSSLSSIIVPDGIQTIENATFANCTSLLSIKIPDSITNIDDYAFSNCLKLSVIIIPKDVERVGLEAFANCMSLAIFCRANSLPTGWDLQWNPNNRPVVWRYKG